MPWYKSDLHIHSVLSPCGSLEMAPSSVIQKAVEEGLDIIAITDHNTLRNSEAYRSVGEKQGIYCFFGSEVQTSEEIHVVALFDNKEDADAFQELLDSALPPLLNDPEFFGDQVVIDQDENIVCFEERLLLNSVLWNLEETLENILECNGFPFLSHIDAPSFSVSSQLGFFPELDNLQAVELTANTSNEAAAEMFAPVANLAVFRNSDAHYIKDIGKSHTYIFMDEPSIANLKKACKDSYNNIKYKS